LRKKKKTGLLTGINITSKIDRDMNPVACPRLNNFDPHDLSSVVPAFSAAPVFQFGQAWLERPEERFLPGEVRIGWSGDQFHVFARLRNDHPFSRATADNQYLWDLGDVFEMFLRDAASEKYAEFHVAPNGRRLQLRFPDFDAVHRLGKGGPTLEALMIQAPQFDFTAWQEPGTWLVCARVPSSALLPPGTSLEGRTWFVSFSRYDYLPGDIRPVLSSTSPHQAASFHRQEEWTPIRFLG
jgi:hypothetical protein